MNTSGLRPDRFDRAGRDQLVDVRDLQAALPGIRRLRTWAHEALALRPGEHAVDIGSGTGTEVIAFAETVGPNGSAVGVEPDPHLLASAERRAAEAGSTAKFHSGDAYGVPFGADSFDAVLCERVFQHLTAPPARRTRSHACCGPAAASWWWTATGARRSCTPATGGSCAR